MSTKMSIEVLKNAGDAENCTASITKIVAQIKRFQERIRKHIDDNYVEFLPNNTSSEFLLVEGETLMREADYLLQNVSNDISTALREANAELASCVKELREVSLGLRLSHRILKVDDLFQCVEEANVTKEYLVVLDLLSKLRSLIYAESGDEIDRMFQKCECYDTIKVMFHIQENILKQNLQQRFENLVQFNEKSFKHAKCVTLQVSKDVNQLHDTIIALFQVRYNPIKMCEFLLTNCFEPLTTKPVSLEFSEENRSYVQLVLSYSLKDPDKTLRPSYKQVFENIRLVIHCLDNINISVSPEQHVFSIVGDQIKERLLTLLVDECLMPAIPETMDELQESTLVEDVLRFEHLLADCFLISAETDRALSEFAEQFETNFRENFSRKLLKTAKIIMAKDLQDMTLVAVENTSEKVSNNVFLFPRCMVSKSTLELVKLLEQILRQSNDDDSNRFLNVIPVVLDAYMIQVPLLHEKLLQSIPQQSALFHNNCMFLAHWLAKNSERGIATLQTLVKTLQATGTKYLQEQIVYQQKLIISILSDFDPTADAHSLSAAPLKLIRQCLRQLDLLRNVWQSVLPEALYNKTFCELLHDFCNDLIRRIIAMEDISSTVANDLNELIGVVLERVPSLFKEKQEVVHIKSWIKLQQLSTILNGSLQEITDLWCDGVGILTANYKAEEVKHLIRALFQNTDRRAQALTKII